MVDFTSKEDLEKRIVLGEFQELSSEKIPSTIVEGDELFTYLKDQAKKIGASIVGAPKELGESYLFARYKEQP